ncbi:MAG: Ig-like domain-containing protein, partial [Coriobacteriia bacterium]|nr:Ig-like domain-containing protein [Coriobacteriia bacterium]
FFYSEDEQANAEAARSEWFDVDTTPDAVAPSLELTTSVEPDGDGIFRLRPKVSASADETAAVYFRWDSSDGVGDGIELPIRVEGPLLPGRVPQFLGGNNWSLYVGPLFVPEGAHTLYAYAVDIHGNRSEISSLHLDVQLPNVGQSPVLQPVDDRTVAPGETLEFTLLAIASEGQPITYSALGLPEGAGLDEMSGVFAWTPSFAQVGSHTITFTASDGVLSHSRTITIVVSVPNHPPTTSDVSASTAANAPVAVTLSASDPDVDELTWLQASPPASGTLLGTAPDLTYVPNTGFVGVDVFSYQVSDGKGGSATAHVTVTVASRGNPIPVYRFYNPDTGAHFYTSDVQERDSVIANLPRQYLYEGIAYVVDPNKNTQPLYRFYNRFKRVHFFTSSSTERDHVIATRKDFTYEGQAYKVSAAAAPDKTPVHRFLNKETGTHFYTTSEAEKNTVISKWPHIYTYEGTAFWLGH